MFCSKCKSIARLPPVHIYSYALCCGGHQLCENCIEDISEGCPICGEKTSLFAVTNTPENFLTFQQELFNSDYKSISFTSLSSRTSNIGSFSFEDDEQQQLAKDINEIPIRTRYYNDHLVSSPNTSTKSSKTTPIESSSTEKLADTNAAEKLISSKFVKEEKKPNKNAPSASNKPENIEKISKEFTCLRTTFFEPIREATKESLQGSEHDSKVKWTDLDEDNRSTESIDSDVGKDYKVHLPTFQQPELRTDSLCNLHIPLSGSRTGQSIDSSCQTTSRLTKKEKPQESSTDLCAKNTSKTDDSINWKVDSLEKIVRQIRQQFSPENVKDVCHILESITKREAIVKEKILKPASQQQEPTMISYAESAVSNYRIIASKAFFVPYTNSVKVPFPQFKSLDEIPGVIPYRCNLNEAREAYEVFTDRSPISCPITQCNQKLVFVSDFAEHLKIDHARIPFENVSPGMYKNFFLDPKSDMIEENKCNMVYLVSDKIKNLGSSRFRNYIPIMVMSTKANLSQLVGNSYDSSDESDPSNPCTSPLFHLIWLTGLYPPNDQMPIHCTLTAWSNQGKVPGIHLVHTGRIYSLRGNQDAKSIYNSGAALVISSQQCHKLTMDGVDMIRLQIVIH